MENFWKIVRHLLGAAGIFLAMKGVGDEALWQTITGLVMTAGMGVYAVFQKKGDVKEMWQSIARHIVTAVAGYLIYKGVMTDVQAENLVGMAVLIAGILASIFNKQ